MDNLEQLEWVDAFAAAGFGARVGVRVNAPALIPLLAARLPPGARLTTPGLVDSVVSVRLGGAAERRGVRNFHLVYHDHVQMARSHDFDAALDSFDTAMRLSLALHARGRTFVHAGAVAWKGRAIVLPGTTMAGKTTLAAALVEAGAEYLSDEYAVLDDAGRVHPFAKPLSLRDEQARQTDVAVTALGGRAARRPAPIGLVVMTQYEPGARWRPRRLTAGEGALQLLSNTIAIRLAPERATAALAAAASHALVVKTKRGEAAEAAAAILTLADRLGRTDPIEREAA